MSQMTREQWLKDRRRAQDMYQVHAFLEWLFWKPLELFILSLFVTLPFLLALCIYKLWEATCALLA